MEKPAARAETRKRIAHLSAERRATKSRRVVEKLLSLPEYQESTSVMFFVPMGDEVDFSPAIDHALANGKIVLVPKCAVQPRRLIVCRIDSRDELAPGYCGISEPRTVREFAAEKIELLLVPGLGFDERGNRLGRGAGYYDRFMSHRNMRALRCAVAFEEQVLPEIPHSESDLPVHILVTDAKIRRFM